MQAERCAHRVYYLQHFGGKIGFNKMADTARVSASAAEMKPSAPQSRQMENPEDDFALKPKIENKNRTTEDHMQKRDVHSYRSYEEAMKAVEEFELSTTTKFVCWKKDKDFGYKGKLKR